jgi:hypothetical protein
MVHKKGYVKRLYVLPMMQNGKFIVKTAYARNYLEASELMHVSSYTLRTYGHIDSKATRIREEVKEKP